MNVPRIASAPPDNGLDRVVARLAVEADPSLSPEVTRVASSDLRANFPYHANLDPPRRVKTLVEYSRVMTRALDDVAAEAERISPDPVPPALRLLGSPPGHWCSPSGETSSYEAGHRARCAHCWFSAKLLLSRGDMRRAITLPWRMGRRRRYLKEFLENPPRSS